jgi:hypothetical protein
MTIYTHNASGSKTVVTNEQNGRYSSRLYVNCLNLGNGCRALGDATLTAAKHSSEKGARAWAAKQVAA